MGQEQEATKGAMSIYKIWMQRLAGTRSRFAVVPIKHIYILEYRGDLGTMYFPYGVSKLCDIKSYSLENVKATEARGNHQVCDDCLALYVRRNMQVMKLK